MQEMVELFPSPVAGGWESVLRQTDPDVREFLQTRAGKSARKDPERPMSPSRVVAWGEDEDEDEGEEEEEEGKRQSSREEEKQRIRKIKRRFSVQEMENLRKGVA
jgi:hypothetical protein